MARLFDWIRKSLVKPHYRKLPNGKIIWIDQYRDSRKEAEKNLAAYRHTAVQADDNSTTVVEGNKLKTYKHTPADEMNEESIHNYLGQTTPIDEAHVWRHWKYNPGLRAQHEGLEMSDSHDLNEVLDGYLKNEHDNAKAEGREPIWESRNDVRKTIEKYEIKPMLKTIKKRAGAAEFTSKADHPALYKAILSSPHADYHEKAEAKMGLEHGEAAKAYWIKTEKENLAASNLRPQDCPKIPHISSKFPLFAHQAEVLAKLNKMKSAIVDVDMGGGKGLLLPYDAINLMHQGKVKRPLIIATGMTLHANAKKILEYTNGTVNVFVFDNKLIQEKYGGDIEKMVEDIKNAPPNTIFMTSYDNISYNVGLTPEEAEDPTKQFQRAQRMSGANFDYVACDESHKIKNAASGRHKAMQYFSGAPYKRLATGTFISRDPADVVGQLSWLYPGKTQNVDEFSRQYGFSKTKDGFNWTDKGVKQLREDLLSQGFISIRRTNWMHQLKDRIEKTSIVKLKPKAAIANEMAVDDAFDAIQALADTDPKIAEELRRLRGDEDDDDDAPTGKVIDAINTLTGIVDHPSEFADKVKAAKALCDKAGADYTYQEDSWKKGYDGEEGEENIPHDVKRAQAFLRKFRPKTLQSILNLSGEVSAKAEDAYAKMREHFKDPKNGKFILFTKRINSARHVFDNLPPDLKKDAVYFDGSNKEGLEPFLQHDKGPKIFIACDEAIKEGVNMQAANALYRYDLGWTPGDVEQSYGRVWRFGQNRPVKIHVGISDGTMDVTKYARLMSRHNSNMKVVSGYDAVPGFMAFKMNIDNIRANRSAEQLGQYEQVAQAVLDYQKEENKKVREVYGDKKYDVAAPGAIAGSKKATGFQYETLEDEQPTEPVKSGRQTASNLASNRSEQKQGVKSGPEPGKGDKPAEIKNKTPSGGEKAESKQPAKDTSKPSNQVPIKKDEPKDLTPDENNEAAEHHLKYAAHHLANENKGLATKHWKTARRHLRQAGKGKRDAHLTHLAKDKEAFKAFAHSMKNKMKDSPHAYVEHKHDKRLPPEEADGTPSEQPAKEKPKAQAHDTMGRTERGLKEKKLESKSSAMDALKQAISDQGYDLADVDDETLGEMDTDLKTYSAHMEGGKDAKAYWKAWAKTHGGAPDDDHKAAIERAAEVLKQRRGK